MAGDNKDDNKSWFALAWDWTRNSMLGRTFGLQDEGNNEPGLWGWMKNSMVGRTFGLQDEGNNEPGLWGWMKNSMVGRWFGLADKEEVNATANSAQQQAAPQQTQKAAPNRIRQKAAPRRIHQEAVAATATKEAVTQQLQQQEEASQQTQQQAAPENNVINRLQEKTEQNIQRITQQLHMIEQLGVTDSYKQMQLISELHEAQNHLQEIEDMKNAERNIQRLTPQIDMKWKEIEKLKEMGKDTTGPSYEASLLITDLHGAQKSLAERRKYENAEQNIQRLTPQIDMKWEEIKKLKEMGKDTTGPSYEASLLIKDLHEAQKYSRELNGEKTNQDNTQTVSNETKGAEKTAISKVPNENNAEESGKSAESGSSLTTLNLAGTKVDNETNYQFRINGAERA